MKERLWKEQSVFKRTMETYENAMAAQSEEKRDITDVYRKVRYWKVCTQTLCSSLSGGSPCFLSQQKNTEQKLKNLKVATAERVSKSLDKVADLEQIVAAREATWDSYKEEETEKIVKKKKVCEMRLCVRVCVCECAYSASIYMIR